jgi:hypothetical protein
MNNKLKKIQSLEQNFGCIIGDGMNNQLKKTQNQAGNKFTLNFQHQILKFEHNKFKSRLSTHASITLVGLLNTKYWG